MLARSLKALLDYEGDVERDLCLTFMADDVPLCHGGEERALTNDNRDEFVDLYIAYKLEDEILQMKASLLRGFARIVGDLETLSVRLPLLLLFVLTVFIAVFTGGSSEDYVRNKPHRLSAARERRYVRRRLLC